MRRVSTLSMVALSLFAMRAPAQEERTIDRFSGVGVRAMGMGGAYVGVADDFTAVYWNPAGLAQMTQREVYVAFSRNAYGNEATQTGMTAGSETRNTRFGSLGVVYPYPVYRGSLVFAAGFNRVKDFDSIVRVPGFDAESFALDHTFTHEGELAMTTLAAAVDVSPSVSLGVALNLIGGDNENTQEQIFNDVSNVSADNRREVRRVLTDDYETVANAILGMLVRTPRENPQVRVGFTIASGPTHKVDHRSKGVPHDFGYNLILENDGTEHRDVVIEEDGTLTPTAVQTIQDRYKISLPIEFGVGGSVRPTPELLVAASVHFGDWTQSEYVGSDVNDVRSDVSFEDRYRDVKRYHIGVEYQVPRVALDLRVGYYTDPLPFIGPRNSDDPIIIAKQDRRFLTLGFGLLLEEAVRANVAWTRGTFEVTEGLLEESNTLNRALFGINYLF